MTRTIDFDAFRAERRAEPVVIRIGGEEYNLAPDLPAEVALDIIDFRTKNGSEAALPNDRVMSIATGLFGDDVMHALLTKHRLTVNELGALVTQVFSEYNGATVPNPTTPTNRAGRRKPKGNSSA